jgi:hypothetical protein
VEERSTHGSPPGSATGTSAHRPGTTRSGCQGDPTPPRAALGGEAAALASFAEGLSDADWQTVIPEEGRTVGVLVHHVASVYPLEVDLAQAVAAGNAVAGVTWDAVAQMNAQHAQENAGVSKQDTLTLLQQNSGAAATRVRALTDAQLDGAAAVSLNADAPLTAQFLIEDHALRHSFHHLATIKAALGR